MKLIDALKTNKKVANAFNYAVIAHRGQTYNDLPYWTHLVTVADNLFDPSEDELVVALLHDVIEDTHVTFADVEVAFGHDIAIAVDLVTSRKGVAYEANIKRIADSKNLTAIRVKMADNKSNMESDKSTFKDKEKLERLMSRWRKSHTTLAVALAFMESPLEQEV